MSIPVVDFAACSLSRTDVTEQQLHALSRELERAFMEVGFVFLKNTGISEDEVRDVMRASRTFFQQPEQLKRAFSRSSFPSSPNHGWVSVEAERLDPRRPGDLKEAFNTASLHPDIKWPSCGALEDFQQSHTSFFLRCKELSLRVLRVMALSLDLDPDVFLKAHSLMGAAANGTTLRSLYYPPVEREAVKAGQLRCGEHSDYGTITLLFQSSEGLQVCGRSGQFVSAPTVPGAVLVNIADLMQRWTSDRFVSVRHRVLLPPADDASTRQSLAFFVHPDDAVLITCCDGSDKYPPITAGDYLSERFSCSYASA